MKVGGEGGTDYIYADTVGRRLYITRGATQAREAVTSVAVDSLHVAELAELVA